MEKLLELLEQDCTMPVSALAAAAGISEDEAKAAMKRFEQDRTILGYRRSSTGTGCARRR